MSFAVKVDPTNPGQFFACCGLLELADRLWPGASVLGQFGCESNSTIPSSFEIVCEQAHTLSELITELSRATLVHVDPEDGTSSPVRIGKPFRELTLEWWLDERAGGKELKVWAGTMESYGIARAMQRALVDPAFLSADLFNVGMVVANPDDATKKKEPYYFDARRCPNAHSRDVGFSANDLGLTTVAHPAVELLCLVGLQRCLPAKTDERRVYDYFTWAEPLGPNLLPAAVSGLLPHVGATGYRFENWYRTGQKKHKAFRSAVPHSKQGAQ